MLQCRYTTLGSFPGLEKLQARLAGGFDQSLMGKFQATGKRLAEGHSELTRQFQPMIEALRQMNERIGMQAFSKRVQEQQWTCQSLFGFSWTPPQFPTDREISDRV